MAGSGIGAPLTLEEAQALAEKLRANVPGAMRELKQWLVWRFEPGDKKPRKMPYYVSGARRTGEQGSDRDRAALATFEAALSVLERAKCSGLGFAFLPGDGLIGIDIDGQVDEQGVASSRAQAIVEACGSYTEFSPSGRGVHVIVAGTSETFKSNDIGLEVFCGRQFFTVTGEPFPGGKPGVATITDAVLRRLKLTVETAKGARSSSPAPSPPPQSIERAELEAALLAISPDLGYDDWIQIGMALQAELGEGGYQLWDYWSSKSAKYAGERDTRSHWKSFGGKAGITAKTIFKFARDAGWKKPRGSRKPSTPHEPLAPAEKPINGSETIDTSTGEIVSAAQAWQRGLRRNEDGKIRNTPANVDLILRHDPGWLDVLAYDEFSYRITKRREPPFPGGRAGPWEETDATKAAVWFERTWGMPVKSKTIDEVARSVAWDARFNVVREWMESIENAWDGVERLPTFLADAFGAEQNDYTAHAGTGMLVTAVARIFKPGCKVDTMVVLEGGQGIGKSTAIIELFSPAWYVDIIEPPSHKDFYIVLQGNWVVEIGEMQSFTRAEISQVKQAITRRDDKFRAPYDKASSEHPRQSIFVGSTNADSYLQDPTGARRFLPIKCAHANVEYCRSMREQLFAEAIHLYRAGFRWWALPDELARYEQDKRYVEDSWVEPINTWLEGQCKPNAYPDPIDVCTVRMRERVRELVGEQGERQRSYDKIVAECTTTDLMRYALYIDMGKHTRQDQMRVGAIMRRLGWDKADTMRVPGTAKNYMRPWMRPPDDPSPQVVT